MNCLFCKEPIPESNFCLKCGKYNVCQSCTDLIKTVDVLQSYHCYWCLRHLLKEENKWLCIECDHIVCEKCTTAEHLDDEKYCNKCCNDLESGY